MDADSLVPMRRVSPKIDTYDPTGFQPIDAVYSDVAVIDSKACDPGSISDHIWFRTRFTL